MANYCYRCGREMADGVSECPVCDKNTYSKKNDDIRCYAPVPEEDQGKKACSTWAYLGLMILFAIPIIGFIAAIICCAVPKNKSINNFAGATIIWQLLVLVICSVAVVRVVSAVKDMADGIFEYVSEVVGIDIDSFDDVKDIVNDVQRITSIVNKIQNGEIEGLPQSVTDIISKYQSGEISSLPDELIDALDKYQSGEISSLPDNIDDIIDEIPEKLPSELPVG